MCFAVPDDLREKCHYYCMAAGYVVFETSLIRFKYLPFYIIIISLQLKTTINLLENIYNNPDFESISTKEIYCKI